MELTDLLNAENIFINVRASNKSDAIKELIDMSTMVEEKKEYIFTKVLEREEIEPTSVGNGIGIAHAKIDNIENIEVAMGIIKEGIDYESYDDAIVKILFVVVAPIAKNREYLNLMAKISRICRHHENVEKIIEMHSGKDIFDFLLNIK